MGYLLLLIVLCLSLERSWSQDILACPDGQSPCAGNRTECIPTQYLCDGNMDCSDGSDEILCQCPYGYLKCNGSLPPSDSNCVSLSLVCDGTADCPEDNPRDESTGCAICIYGSSGSGDAIESMCLNTQLMLRASEIANCSAMEPSGMCSSSECSNLLLEIYNACNFNISLDELCAVSSGGGSDGGSGGGSGGGFPEPTPEQLMCFNNRSMEMHLQLVDACGTSNLTAIDDVCGTSNVCFTLISEINFSCGYFYIYDACSNQADVITDEQINCLVHPVSQSRLISACGFDHLYDVNLICSDKACFDAYISLYTSCNTSFGPVEEICRPDGIQCPMTDSCLRNSELCDGQADCAVSGYDESPVICGCPDPRQIPFECSTDTYLCLNRTQICDGVIDCNTTSRDELPGTCTPPQPVTITPSKNLSVLLGDYISINCSPVVPSSEDFTYTWTHLDSILEEDSSILTLSSVSMEELGTYSCNIASPSSSGSAQATITSARPVIDAGVYSAISTTSCSSLQQAEEEVTVDVLQLLADRYGVRPLGLSRSYSAESCDQVAEANPGSMSGLYWISNGEDPVQLQCNF